MITIYLPTHNRRPLVARAIESVLAQSYEDFELIVINDGSSDDTAQFLRTVCAGDGRIRVLHNEKPIGACGSRNRAIREARGFFVTGLDDDDLLLPDHLASLLTAYRAKATEGGATVVFPGTFLRRGGRDKINRHQKGVVTYDDLLASNRVGNQVFAPRSVFMDAGLFDERMPAWQDYELWIRMAGISGKMYHSMRVTYIQDESHAQGRISGKSFEIVRLAYSRMCEKHLSISSERKRLRLMINYHSYPQAPMSLGELSRYLSHGLVIRPSYHFFRKRFTVR